MNQQQYAEYIDKSSKLIKILQKEANFIVNQIDMPLNWNSLLSRLKEDVGSEVKVYTALASLLNIKFYNEELIIHKTKNIAISNDTIFVINPIIAEEDIKLLINTKFIDNYKIGLITQNQIDNVKIQKDKTANSEQKILKLIINEIKRALHDDFSKINISYTNNILTIEQNKNKRRVFWTLKTKSSQIDDIVQNALKYIEDICSTDFILTMNTFNSFDKDAFASIKSQRLNVKIKNLSDFGMDKGTLKGIQKAMETESGLIFIGGQKDSGKTTLLKSIITNIQLNQGEKKIDIYSDESVFDDLNLTVYKNSSKIEGSSDTIIIDGNQSLDMLNSAILESVRGTLVIISLETKSALDSLRFLRYKDEKLNRSLLAGELLGVYHQQLIPMADPKSSEDIKFISHKMHKKLSSYKNKPSVNNYILQETKSDRNIMPLKMVSEWITNSDLIKENLKNNFDLQEIIIDQKSFDWIDMVENSLKVLKNKEITIDDLKRHLILF